MLNIGRYRLRASSCPDIYRNSMTTIAEEKDEVCIGVQIQIHQHMFAFCLNLELNSQASEVGCRLNF